MYYIHRINPHLGHEMHDLILEGKLFGLTKSDTPPTMAVEFILFLPDQHAVDYALANNVGKVVLASNSSATNWEEA